MMNRHFPKLTIELGTVKENRTIQFSFPIVHIGKIHRIMTSCDCTVAEENIKHNKIDVEWKPNKIPEKTKAKGFTEVKKSVTLTVVYGPEEDPSRQHIVVLGFNGIVTTKQI